MYVPNLKQFTLSQSSLPDYFGTIIWSLYVALPRLLKALRCCRASKAACRSETIGQAAQPRSNAQVWRKQNHGDIRKRNNISTKYHHKFWTLLESFRCFGCFWIRLKSQRHSGELPGASGNVCADQYRVFCSLWASFFQAQVEGVETHTV